MRRDPERGDDEVAGEPGGRVPELLRRVVGVGLSGFFLTEEVLRKALGDSMPRDWIDFASEQSQRARDEVIDRLAAEVGRAVQGVDLRELAERLLQGHTVEVTARIRFLPKDDPES